MTPSPDIDPKELALPDIDDDLNLDKGPVIDTSDEFPLPDCGEEADPKVLFPEATEEDIPQVASTGKNGKALQYKSYRGKHWSLKAYPVVKLVDTVHSEKYYVNGAWRFRDQLLKVPGVDMQSRARVVQKHKSRKKDYVDELQQAGYAAALALGDPEDQPS